MIFSFISFSVIQKINILGRCRLFTTVQMHICMWPQVKMEDGNYGTEWVIVAYKHYTKMLMGWWGTICTVHKEFQICAHLIYPLCLISQRTLCYPDDKNMSIGLLQIVQTSGFVLVVRNIGRFCIVLLELNGPCIICSLFNFTFLYTLVNKL